MSYRKMPHNNRLSGSAALRTNDMWSKTIGHDPYANQQVDTIDQMSQSNMASQSASLLLLAKMSNLSGMESRGGCTKCGALGHLTFQCRNKVSSIIANNDNDSSSTSSSDDEDNNNIDINKQNVSSTQLLHVGSSKMLDSTLSTKKRNRSNSEASEKHKKSAKHKKHKHNKDTKKSKNSKKDKNSKKIKHNNKIISK